MEHRNTFRKGDGISDTTIRRTIIQQAYKKQSGQGKNLKRLKNTGFRLWFTGQEKYSEGIVCEQEDLVELKEKGISVV